MNPLSEIRKSIKGMTSGNGRLFTAKVLSTDGETCCVDIDGLVVSDVRLRAVVNGEESGILVTPKTDSFVTVADLSGNLTRLVVVGFSEVEKIEVNADDKIIFNGGQNKGLIQIEKLTQKLNDLVNAFNDHTHQVSTTGGPTAQSGVAQPPAPTNPFNKSDYEDTNITH